MPNAGEPEPLGIRRQINTMQIAIIGLPNSTKTTIFNALTRGNLETSAFSSGIFEVHTAVVDVPDPRVDKLSAMFKPRKTTYAKVTYADIAGLAKGVERRRAQRSAAEHHQPERRAAARRARLRGSRRAPRRRQRQPAARRRDRRRRAAAFRYDHRGAAHRTAGSATEEGRRKAGEGRERGRTGADAAAQERISIRSARSAIWS